MERLDTETRQEQIKKAVLEIISTEGLARLSTRNLAAKVGVTEGAIFRHFKTKKDIVASIIDDVKKNLLLSQKAIAYGNVPARDRLFDFLCRHVTYLVENRGITILLFSEAAYMNEPRLKEELFEILNGQRKYVGKIIEDGIKEGIWDKAVDVNNASMLYMGIPISLNIELILNKKGFRQENFCKNMMCLIERTLNKA